MYEVYDDSEWDKLLVSFLESGFDLKTNEANIYLKMKKTEMIRFIKQKLVEKYKHFFQSRSVKVLESLENSRLQMTDSKVANIL